MPNASEVGRRYQFDRFRLDCRERQLFRDGALVALQPKVFDTLVLFLDQPGTLIGKSEMMDALWPGISVGESALTKNISDLRKALGDATGGVVFIETVPKSGYRFVAPVEIVERDGNIALLPPIVAHAKRTTIYALLLVGLILVTGVSWLFVSRRLAVSKVAGIHSLAVLPFRPMSAQQRDEYLELGMADALISHLNVPGHLEVRSTSSVRKYAAERWDAVDAGRRLRVDAVIEGSVQKLDNALRVTAHMLRVKDGAVLWSGSIDDVFPNLFAVQDSLARQIMTALSVKLTPAEQKRLTKHATTDIEAYEWYQKGRFFAEHRTAEGFEKAISYYQRALAKDPQDALAWSGLSDAYMLTAWYYTRPASGAHALAKEAALRSVTLDDTLAEAHTSMGVVFENADWDFKAADREFRRALENNPNHVTAQHWYGEFLGMMGHSADAMAHLQRAQQLDPVSPIIGADTAKTLIDARLYGEAIKECQRTLELDATFLPARGWLQNAYLWSGRYRESQLLTAQLEPTKERLYSLQDWSIFYALSGRPDKAAEFSRKFQQMAIGKHVPAFRWAILYLLAQPNRDKAVEWLSQAYKERDAYMLSLKVSPDFDSVRSDPRFEELVKRMDFLD